MTPGILFFKSWHALLWLIMVVKQRVSLDFHLKGCRLSAEFLIAPHLSEDVIIGVATLQKWRLKLDVEHDDVIVDKKRVSRMILK